MVLNDNTRFSKSGGIRNDTIQTYNNDSDSDEKLTVLPKLSNFGSALISEKNENITRNSLTNSSISMSSNYNQINTLTKNNEIGTINSNFNNGQIASPKFKGIKNLIDQEMTVKHNERRKGRRIFRKIELNSLGKAKRTNLDYTIAPSHMTEVNYDQYQENDHKTFESMNDMENDIPKYKTTTDSILSNNKSTDNLAGKNSKNHVTTPSSSFGSTLYSSTTNPFTDSNTYNHSNTSLPNTMIDYNLIEIGDLNPFQVLKKYNLPSTELATISKLYFEKQKEENRKNIMKKRSVSKEGFMTSISSNSVSSKISRQSSFHTTTNNRHSSMVSKQDTNAILMNTTSTRSDEKVMKPLNEYEPDRKVLASIDINKNINVNAIEKKRPVEHQYSYEKSKIHISESRESQSSTVEKPHTFQDNKEGQKIVKKVEIVEPPTSMTNRKSSKSIVSVNDIEYERIELLGRGGSSKVYKVKNTNNNRVYALKRVVFDEFDDTSVDAFKGEIELLKKLENEKRVVKLIQYQMDNGVLYLVMECGDHDLSQILNQRANMPLDVDFIRYYSREMLKCVKVVHDAGIVHSDLKPANFVLVKGILKIIDFGIANAVPDHTVNIYRDTQIGTPNYMAPEALVALNEVSNVEKKNRWRVGKPSDIWSCGCIMYQMFYGRPPYGAFQNQNRLLAIMNPEVKIVFSEKTSKNERVPKSALDTMKACLIRSPEKRWTADEILDASFLNPVLVTPYIVRDLIRNAVYYGSDQGQVSEDKITELADDVLNRLADFRL
ncbi:hypothetical protein TPHA_0M00300 [Tetrapisispora phaffii CBS 4417]|uniref:Protein kinase domain-containing protein n=1 Tax=Tetrapisispora phaffii (strain ATCC 24235 / CBS 4417 / NBRC 1672 / NRRL Y-8282 / UCD 70-5) TaxID=1071381 RepID=G8C0U6_TETPH|nr:hypothetical protein TPHA_0M00300 [Tetrapisispora phaffii CBS 4417]CCE65607.1 hypothetical protein TPHA_0M00300 [Tetrapisispora phaffii CBS 4417]